MYNCIHRFELELAARRRGEPNRPMSCVDGSYIASDFCGCDGLSVQSCVRPVCVAIATGPDEFRKQGSYRLNDLGGRDIGRSVLTLG